MCFSYSFNGMFYYFAHACIVPAFQFIYFYTVCILIFLHTLQSRRNGAFGSLVFFGNRYSVAIIPNKNRQRNLQNACSIHGFPKVPFACSSIPNGAKANFISIIAQRFQFI